MVKLTFNALGYSYQSGIDILLKSYTSARQALENDFEQAADNAAAYQHAREEGICFGFDLPKDHVRQVTYTPTRPMVDRDRLFADMESGHAEMKRWLNVKYDHWAYEQEWRADVLLDPAERHADGNWYQPFSPDLRLAEVIVGEGSRLTRIDLHNLLGDLSEHVRVWQTRLAFRPVYEVVLQQDRRRW